MLKFGTVDTTDATLETIPGSIIVGIICGFLGALFIEVNTYLGYARKRFIKTPIAKVIEVCVFSFLTTSAFFWVPAIFSCYEKSDDFPDSTEELLVSYDCPEG